MISDVDEIPDIKLLTKIKFNNYNIDLLSLQLDTYYYNLNSRCDAYRTASKIFSYKKYKQLNNTIQEIRISQVSSIVNAGWHLSFLVMKILLLISLKLFLIKNTMIVNIKIKII